MEKYDLTNLNTLIQKTWKLIDNNPLTVAVDEVSLIKKQFEAIQNSIEDKQPEKSKTLLQSIFSGWGKRDENFQYKDFEGKINSIFSQFDLIHWSIKHTIKMYESYEEWLVKENAELLAYIAVNDIEWLSIEDMNQLNHYKIMLSTLQLSDERIKLSLKSAHDLESTMEVTKPIFQAVLSSCMIELAGQQTLDSSIRMQEVLKGTIETMSTKLTEASVHTAHKALEISTTPLLEAPKLKANILMLSNALQEIEKKKSNLILTSWKDGQDII